MEYIVGAVLALGVCLLATVVGATEIVLFIQH
jgi:hypothetical protein